MGLLEENKRPRYVNLPLSEETLVGQLSYIFVIGTGLNVEVRKKENFHLPTFNTTVVLQATNNISDFNKIGEGEDLPHLQGNLFSFKCDIVDNISTSCTEISGQEIAVKKLS